MSRPFLCLALLLVGCGGDSDETSSPKPATVALSFENPSTADVFVDATYRPYEFSREGKVLPGSHDCTPACGASCECYFCGAPQNVVRRIPPGATWQINWSGEWYELAQECGGGQCACDRARRAAFGSVHVEVLGARGKQPSGGTAMPSDPNLFQGMVDTASGSCSGSADFELDASEKSVAVPFVCTP